MNDIGKKFLPLGTVVMLKGGEKRLMITGFCTMSMEDENKKMYDYSGCLYPEGIITSNQSALFDHNQIEKVYFLGFKDQEEIEFKSKLEQFLTSKPTNPVNKLEKNKIEIPKLVIEDFINLPKQESIETLPDVNSADKN